MESNLKYKVIVKNVLFYLALVFFASGYVLVQDLANLDEIWVYNFGRCIADGLLPYKDISMVITPLFPMIGAIFLKVFGNELFVFRILECFQIAAILFMFYKIMRRLKMNKGFSLIAVFSLFVGYSHLEIFCFDYNWAVLLLELIVVYYELKNVNTPLERNTLKDITFGILARMCDFYKADFGTLFCSLFCFL